MIGQTEAIAQKVQPMTTTDPSSGSSAPRDVHVTPDTGRVIIAGQGVSVAVGSAYAAAAAAFPDRERKELAAAQPPKFQKLDDPILHIIAAGVEPAGPYVGNPNLPEEVLQVFAQYEQREREKKRERDAAERARRASLVEKIVLLLIGAIIGGIGVWLRAQFFP
jgi:hypothetical protein